MSKSLTEEKRSARRMMKSTLQGISPGQRTSWSESIQRALAGLPKWGSAATVLAFLPMKTEVDTTFVIDAALSEGKEVGVPRMYGPDIRFHRVTSLAGPWEKHSFGVVEPPEDAPVLEPRSICKNDVFVVTPGLCFDDSGGRLGFGKGYYDKFISTCRAICNEKIFFVGVCFNVQIVDCVPTGDHDCLLDALVTESGIQYQRGAHNG